MFDTVRLRASNIFIEHEQLLRHEVIKNNVLLDEETGALKRYVQIKSTKIPFINYNEGGRSLEVEVSIPKYLFGENVSMVKRADIDNFFHILHGEIKVLLGVSISSEEWIGKRVDVCWNFQVDGMVQDYLRQLGQIKLARMNTHTINQVETVYFRNRSKKVMFYDKERECAVRRCAFDVIEKAKGVLRMEIQPSYNDIKKYSESRKAVDLLTKEFFKHVTAKQILTLHLPETSDVTFEFVRHHQYRKVEMGLGFQKLLLSLGEGGILQIYPSSTIDLRRSMLKELDMQPSLPSLRIDYDKL